MGDYWPVEMERVPLAQLFERDADRDRKSVV